MRIFPSPETRETVLRHPFVLAGAAVVALLGITAGIFVIVDSARGDSTATPHVGIEPHDTQTPGPVAKTATAGGVFGRTNATTAVRRAPDQRTALGTLPRDSDVTVDGRSSEGKWYRIIFPPNSELHGWVDADFIDITGEEATLPIVTPEPAVIVELPTTDPSLRLTPLPTDPPTPIGSVIPTATADSGLPDLVIGSTPVISQGKLFVTVINQGSGTATGDLVVAIFSADGTQLLGGATVNGFSLGRGLSIDVGTGYEVSRQQSLVLIVDPNGEIEESDNTNNRVAVAVAAQVPPP